MKHESVDETKGACERLWHVLSNETKLARWEEASAVLSQFAGLLLAAGRTRGLLSTSQRNQAAIWEHIYDSLQALRLVDGARERHLADAGSGNGFPGIPLAIALGDTKVSLIERSSRKAEFLEYAAARLSLSNVIVRCCEIADFNWIGEGVDLVLLRALVRPAEFGSLFRGSGACPQLIVYTTPGSGPDWLNCASTLGYQDTGTCDYVLPQRSARRQLIKFSARRTG